MVLLGTEFFTAASVYTLHARVYLALSDWYTCNTLYMHVLLLLDVARVLRHVETHYNLMARHATLNFTASVFTVEV